MGPRAADERKPAHLRRRPDAGGYDWLADRRTEMVSGDLREALVVLREHHDRIASAPVLSECSDHSCATSPLPPQLHVHAAVWGDPLFDPSLIPVAARQSYAVK